MIDLGSVNLRLKKPKRVAQGRVALIKFLTEKPLAIQIDGEPSSQQPGLMRISLIEKVMMLSTNSGFIEDEYRKKRIADEKYWDVKHEE